jgi:hypothetical protein
MGVVAVVAGAAASTAAISHANKPSYSTTTHVV